MTHPMTVAASLHGLSSTTLMALLPIVAVLLALDVYALNDLRRASAVRYLPKLVWALVIVLVSAPLGALVYLAVGRSHNDELPAPGDGSTQPEGSIRY